MKLIINSIENLAEIERQMTEHAANRLANKQWECTFETQINWLGQSVDIEGDDESWDGLSIALRLCGMTAFATVHPAEYQPGWLAETLEELAQSIRERIEAYGAETVRNSIKCALDL